MLSYHSLEDRISKRVMRGSTSPNVPRDFPVRGDTLPVAWLGSDLPVAYAALDEIMKL